MTHDPLAHPVARVRAAVAAREGALAAWRHSPNAETERVVIATMATLNYRLEQLWSGLTDRQRWEVERRETNRPTMAASASQGSRSV